MRLNKYNLLTSTALVLLFTGCVQFQDLAAPTKVQVKTNAEYNFTVAEFEKDFSDMLTAEKLKGKIGSGFELYDYNPNGNQKVQQYLLRMPLQEVPLDFGSYMESIDIGQGFEAMSFEQSFEIPDLQINEEQEVDLDVLNTMMIGVLNVTGTTETGPQKVGFTGFSTVTIASGKLTITSAANGTVKLYSKSGLTEAGCDSTNLIATGTMSRGKVTLDLSGKTLYANGTYIDFVDDASGTAFGGIFNENARFSTVTDLTQSEEQSIAIDPMTFPGAGDSSPVKNCVFSDDSAMSLTISTDGWTGVSIDKTVTVTGGLDLTLSGSTATVTSSLKDKSYTNQDITLDSLLKLKFTNATIDFSKKPKFVLASDIKGFKTVTAKLPEGVQTQINVNQDLPSSASSMVKKLTWNAGSGIKISYSNTLPAGNAMDLTAKSDFIGLSSTKQTIETTTGSEKKTLEFLSAAEKPVTISSATKVDFTATLTLPNYVAADNTITMVGVEPGKTYKIALDITPVFDWKEVELDMSALNGFSSISGKMALDFNPATMLQSIDEALGLTGADTISDKIKLSKLDIKLFCEKPDYSAFRDVRFKGKIALGSTSDDGTSLSNSVYLLGSATEEKDLVFYKEPVLEKNDKGIVITDLSRVSCVGKDLAPTINSITGTNKLGLNYTMGLTGTNGSTITVTKDSLGSSTNTSLKITAMIILPLELKVESDCNIDVMKMAGKEFKSGDPDLLGRTEITSDSGTLDKLLSVIDRVSVTYAPSKKPLIGNAEILIDLDGSGTDFDQQTISINGGIYSEQPSKILNNLVRPTVKVCLKQGTLSLPRDMAFKTRLDLKIKTNGEPLEFGGN